MNVTLSKLECLCREAAVCMPAVESAAIRVVKRDSMEVRSIAVAGRMRTDLDVIGVERRMERTEKQKKGGARDEEWPKKEERGRMSSERGADRRDACPGKGSVVNINAGAGARPEGGHPPLRSGRACCSPVHPDVACLSWPGFCLPSRHAARSPSMYMSPLWSPSPPFPCPPSFSRYITIPFVSPPRPSPPQAFDARPIASCSSSNHSFTPRSCIPACRTLSRPHSTLSSCTSHLLSRSRVFRCSNDA